MLLFTILSPSRKSELGCDEERGGKRGMGKADRLIFLDVTAWVNKSTSFCPLF
jgi:hypothetical protein